MEMTLEYRIDNQSTLNQVRASCCQPQPIHYLIPCSPWCLSHIQPRAPYDFYHLYDFLPVRPSDAPVGIFTSVLFSWSHQTTGPVRLETAVHLWFGRMIRRTPRVPRAMPVRASYGPRKGIFNVFHIPRDPYGTRKAAIQHPYGHVRELIQPKLTKIPHRRRIWSCGARTDPQGRHTTPLRTRKGIDTTKIDKNPAQASYLVVQGPYGPRTGCSGAV